MKKFVVDCGKAIIDISAWIFVIMIIVAMLQVYIGKKREVEA